MPITLLTGTPGAGKTLYAVKLLVEQIAPTGRPIVTNIAGLDVDFENVTIDDGQSMRTWQDFEDGTYFIFDECQHVYVPRNPMSKVPAFIAGYETHRHRGFDFLFVTQGPSLIDRHFFPLIDRHLHVYRPFGLKRSTVLEWNGVNPTPAPKQSRSNALVKNFRFPAKYFKYYRSSTQHTVKLRLPIKVITTVSVAALCACGVLYYAFFQLPKANLLAQVSNETGDLQELIDEGMTQNDCIRYLGRSGSQLVFAADSTTIRLNVKDLSITGNTVVNEKNGKELAICNTR